MAATGPEFLEPGAKPERATPDPTPVASAVPSGVIGVEPIAPLEPFAHGTLGRRLVIRVTALVALTAILISLFTALATRELLLQQLDRQVDSVAGRIRSGPPNGRPGDSAGLVQVGNPQDTIYAGFTDDGRSTSGIARTGGSRPAPLPTDVLEQLGQLPVTGRKQSIEIPGLGRYRVVTYQATLVSLDTG
ncbi:MAG: hypothetical protein EOP01_02880, partial [Propionibacteriaceae bacterium]